MKLLRKIMAALVMAPVYLVLSIENAIAAGTLGGIAKSATSDLVSIGGLVEVGAYIAGIVFVTLGITKFVQASNQPGSPKGPAMVYCIAGVALLGIGAMITATSGTFGGSGASTGLGKLGIGG
jgi:hypothetical protein